MSLRVGCSKANKHPKHRSAAVRKMRGPLLETLLPLPRGSPLSTAAHAFCGQARAKFPANAKKGACSSSSSYSIVVDCTPRWLLRNNRHCVFWRHIRSVYNPSIMSTRWIISLHMPEAVDYLKETRSHVTQILCRTLASGDDSPCIPARYLVHVPQLLIRARTILPRAVLH
jgi:hypothetical protein